MRPSAGPGTATRYMIFVFFLYTRLWSVSTQAITKRIKFERSNITLHAIRVSIKPKCQSAAPCEGKEYKSQCTLFPQLYSQSSPIV